MKALPRPYSCLLVQYLRPQWKRAAWMAALISISIAFQVASPQVLRRFLDQVTQGAAAQAITRTAALFSQFTVQVAGNGALVLVILFLIWLEDWRAGALLTAYAMIAFPSLQRFQI